MSYDAYAMGHRNGLSDGHSYLDKEKAEYPIPEHVDFTQEEANQYIAGYNDGYSKGQQETEFSIKMSEKEKTNEEELEID